LCQQYANDPKKSVWNKDYIKEKLLDMTNKKCAYCESSLALGFEIDHFYCRTEHPKLVVRWDNLLPVCHHCNTVKKDYDCAIEPIINPTMDNPQKHLIYYHCEFFPYNDSKKGQSTITCLELNDTSVWGEKRYSIYKNVTEDIKVCLHDLNYITGPLDKKAIQLRIIEMFKDCLKGREYSALYATEILQHALYTQLKKKLKDTKMWTKQINTYEKIAQRISLA
jgi:uncharacterized protein (TIGR02646 family)